MGEGLKLRQAACAVWIVVLLSACGGSQTDRASDGKSPAAGHDDRHGGDPTAAASPAAVPGEGGHMDGQKCAPSGIQLTIAAKDVKFDKDCLAAPSGQRFSVEFNNAEALPHNVTISRKHNSSDVFFRGEVFTGPATRTYRVDALQPGKFHFHCDVHPEMQGDFIVG